VRSMKRLKRLLATIFLSFSLAGCSALSVNPGMPTGIPPRPALAQCPAYPDVRGKVVDVEGVGKHVMLTLEDAKRLSAWIHAYLVCSQENQAELLGHLEKLENRIRALSPGGS